MSMDDYTTNTRITDRQDTSSDPGDFGPLLESLQLSYIRNGHYYQVGELTPVCGWIIDLSVVESQVDPLLRQVLPILIREQVPFKIPQSSEVAKALLAGLLGYSDIGKIVSIFPGSPGKARQIAALLVSQLHAWHGPAIPAHYPLGGIVYTRFGGYAPVEIAGDDGRLSVFNQDARGNWMPETSPIPFRLPRGLTWPYERLCKYRKLKDKRFLRGRYLLTHALKRDAKGRVMRAFDLRRWWDIRMCIVKEGIRHMSSDSSGRDIADRLQWQHTLHHSLARTIPLPKVIDYFEDRGNVYFVMEYIEGMAMSEVINTIYQSTHWSSLGVDRQRLLTTHFLSILDMLINLHETGYYHRDLSPRNFILTHGGRIVCIDLELVYDFRQHQPDPPFQLGTAGYAAPEQLRSEPPTAAQDVYGIGGLLIRFFTSLSPKHYQWDDPDRMIRQLSFLCGSKAMARLISRCLHIDPMERPTLTYIRNEIRFLRRATAYKSPRPLQYPSEGECRTTIVRAIACLGTLKMSTPEGIWFSRVIRPQRYLNNESLETGYYTGFRQGVGGILYFLSLARMAGYAVAPALPQLQTGWQYLHDNCLLSGSGLQPGLYNGAASTSLAYIKAVEAGFIQMPEDMLPILVEGFHVPAPELGIAGGLAGQGLAVLQCRDFLGAQAVDHSLGQFAGLIMERQHRNGSWTINQDGGAQNRRSGITTRYSFSRGMAGVIYFLLAVYETIPDPDLLSAACAGLQYLESRAERSGSALYWPTGAKGGQPDPWLEHGVTGIALPFIKAYAITGETRYKEIATTILLGHGDRLVTPFLSIASGAAGIGIAYISAWQAFKEAVWKERAAWIVQLLLNTVQPQRDGTLCWSADNSSLACGDLLVGNTGIIHFLMRYLDPGITPLSLFI